MKDEVKRYVLDEVLRGAHEGPLGPDDDLIDVAGLDSLGLIRLIRFLEERFGVQVKGHEVVPSNFRTLNAIEAFVTTKQAERTGAGD